MSRDPYLIPNRLEDVIFLIQYLGLGKNANVAKGTPADGVSPKSNTESKGWERVASEHREFFRVTNEGTVSLAYRYYLRDGGKLEPLGLDLVHKLVQNAMTLHERQAKRVEVWRGWITATAAGIAAIAGIVSAIAGIATLYLKK